MSSLLLSNALGQTVDDHITWFGFWTRMAVVECQGRLERMKNFTPPPSFGVWRRMALEDIPQERATLDRLADLYEHLHKTAWLILLKTPDGAPVDAKDFESIADKYLEFVQSLRRMERAFAAAASGLDQLTGLRSRVGMQEDLARENSRFLRIGKSFCIAIMDIDHFKKINDTYGHDAGDRVLASVADHISRSLRPFDDAYRMGGEEFLLCLKEADATAGAIVLERLRMGLEKSPILLAEGKSISVTASFGFIVSDKELTPEALLHRADEALYEAKKRGRNRIVLAD